MALRLIPHDAIAENMTSGRSSAAIRRSQVSIPDYQLLMLPVLEIGAKGEVLGSAGGR